MRKKNWLYKLSALGVFLLLLNGCGPAKKQPQADCGFVQNIYGERISWKSQAPIPLYVDQSFPDEMLPALEAALDSWAIVFGRPLFEIKGTHFQGGSGAQRDSFNVIYWKMNWDSSRPDEQARTSVVWQGDRIVDADIAINNLNFKYYLGDVGPLGAIHLESLLIHELGHVLGLKHKDNGQSVMATYLKPLTLRDTVSDQDSQNLKCEYQ